MDVDIQTILAFLKKAVPAMIEKVLGFFGIKIEFFPDNNA